LHQFQFLNIIIKKYRFFNFYIIIVKVSNKNIKYFKIVRNYIKMLNKILFCLSLLFIVTFITNGVIVDLFTNNAFAQIMQQNQTQQGQSQTNQTSLILKKNPSSLQGSFFNIDNITFSHHVASVNGI
jgi:hypothetical protein